MFLNGYPIEVAKKEVEKAIINELYVKEFISFNQYNIIIKKIEKDISNLMKLFNENTNIDTLKNLVVDVAMWKECGEWIIYIW